MNTAAQPLAHLQRAYEDLFTHAVQSTRTLQKEIDVRKTIARNVQKTLAVTKQLSADNAESIIANAIISIEHAKDELRPLATHLRDALITEEFLWESLLRHIINPAEPALQKHITEQTIDGIIALLDEQAVLLSPDHLMGHSRRAA